LVYTSGMTGEGILNREAVLSAIHSVRSELTVLKVHHIYLFGSVARNEGHSGSDLDFLVEFTETVSLFELINLKIFLETLFRRKVDIVPTEDLRAEIRTAVLKDAICAA
jgi:predicted nucleotidyltransferase